MPATPAVIPLRRDVEGYTGGESSCGSMFRGCPLALSCHPTHQSRQDHNETPPDSASPARIHHSVLLPDQATVMHKSFHNSIEPTRSTDFVVSNQTFLLGDGNSETPNCQLYVWWPIRHSCWVTATQKLPSWDGISKAPMLLWQIRSTHASMNFRDPIACESFRADNGTQIVSVGSCIRDRQISCLRSVQ